MRTELKSRMPFRRECRANVETALSFRLFVLEMLEVRGSARSRVRICIGYVVDVGTKVEQSERHGEQESDSIHIKESL